MLNVHQEWLSPILIFLTTKTKPKSDWGNSAPISGELQKALSFLLPLENDIDRGQGERRSFSPGARTDPVVELFPKRCCKESEIVWSRQKDGLENWWWWWFARRERAQWCYSYNKGKLSLELDLGWVFGPGFLVVVRDCFLFLWQKHFGLQTNHHRFSWHYITPQLLYYKGKRYIEQEKALAQQWWHWQDRFYSYFYATSSLLHVKQCRITHLVTLLD